MFEVTPEGAEQTALKDGVTCLKQDKVTSRFVPVPVRAQTISKEDWLVENQT